MTRDNVEYVPEWIYRQDVNQPTSRTSADSPPEVDEESWTAPLERAQSRDVLLLCLAGMVIIACLAFWAGTRA